MKIIAPDYYSEFKCIAGDCRHTCCAGWEIDIDEESLRRFMDVPGKPGDKLRANIRTDNEGAHFILTEDKRCPFLDGDGLCELISQLGEASLCQICADHPRFRNYWSDREELGLGLCCEAAGYLILGREEPVTFVTLMDDGRGAALSGEEAGLMEFRFRLIAAAQDRSLPVSSRTESILAELGGTCSPCFERWRRLLSGLETLDASWRPLLKHLSDSRTAAEQLRAHETAFEQLLVYLLWRHVPYGAWDSGAELSAVFAVLMWFIVRKICEGILLSSGHLEQRDIVEVARLYSGEIEYSDENIGTIIDELCENGL